MTLTIQAGPPPMVSLLKAPRRTLAQLIIEGAERNRAEIERRAQQLRHWRREARETIAEWRSSRRLRRACEEQNIDVEGWADWLEQQEREEDAFRPAAVVEVSPGVYRWTGPEPGRTLSRSESEEADG